MNSLFGRSGVEFSKDCGDYQIAHHNNITVRVACWSGYSARWLPSNPVKFNLLHCKHQHQPESGNVNTHQTLFTKVVFFIKTYTNINKKKTLNGKTIRWNQMKILQVCYNLVEETIYPYCFWLGKCTQNCQNQDT